MIHQREDGKFIVATYIPTKARFRCNYTRDKIPFEAQSLEDLKTATGYKNRASAKRAIRKRRVVVK
jgi:hypothetical protein